LLGWRSIAQQATPPSASRASRSPQRASPLDSRKRHSSPAAAKQGFVRGIDDRVEVEGGDVGFHDFN
jgi:hypothetical protein